jgi:hypothetical protein
MSNSLSWGTTSQTDITIDRESGGATIKYITAQTIARTALHRHNDIKFRFF